MLVRQIRAALVLIFTVGTASAGLPAISVNELVRLNRIADVEASPDGRRVSYTLRTNDMDANEARSSIWLLDTGKRNALPVRLTDDNHPESSALWSGDGRYVYFLSSRSGSAQVWRSSAAGGEAAVQITNLPLDVGSFRLSPGADRIFLTMEVYRHCLTLDCTKKRIEAASKPAASGALRNQLFVRHWDTWADGRRSQLFSIGLNADGIATANPVKLSIDIEGDIPDKPFGGREDYAVSPDGSTVVFAARTAGAKEPWARVRDLYRVLATGGERARDGRPLKDAEPVKLIPENRVWSGQPAFSPDGSQLAYLTTDRAGFDADRCHLMLLNLKTHDARPLTQHWDKSISRFSWSRDGKSLFATAEHLGQRPLWKIDARTGMATPVTGEGEVETFSVGVGKLFYTLSTLAGPADLYSVGLGAGKGALLAQANPDLHERMTMSPYEQFTFTGANNETVYGYLVMPTALDPARKYPLALLVHDGPHASFGNRWDSSLNAQILAGAGFGVVTIDFHGSTGYGQAFADSINGDWGGKPLDDLKAGVAAALDRYTWLDGSRLCALGEGYGGYMVNWIAGQWPDRFKCLVNHGGIFDNRSQYYTTDELWAPEWEMSGAEYDNPQGYAKQNPIDYVKNWRTPMFFSHGELDYQVPYTQGLAAFTAQQRHGYPGELLTFHDENHMISKPANTVQWYEAVLAWIKRWTRP